MSWPNIIVSETLLPSHAFLFFLDEFRSRSICCRYVNNYNILVNWSFYSYLEPSLSLLASFVLECTYQTLELLCQFFSSAPSNSVVDFYPWFFSWSKFMSLTCISWRKQIDGSFFDNLVSFLYTLKWCFVAICTSGFKRGEAANSYDLVSCSS